jgi:hypothetical protein
MRSLVQPGSQTTSTFASVMPATLFAACCDLAGQDLRRGQPGAVSVMRIAATPSAVTNTS